jgi:hypothetical protein
MARCSTHQKGRIVRRIFIVLLFALMGVTGTASAAVAAATPFPPGGQATTEGQWISLSCGGSLQILDPTATYYDKHGDVLAVVVEPDLAAVNQYGEFVSVGFRSPKKAVYVISSYGCAPATPS